MPAVVCGPSSPAVSWIYEYGTELLDRREKTVYPCLARLPFICLYRFLTKRLTAYILHNSKLQNRIIRVKPHSVTRLGVAF
jgi:hypothetical protein